MDKTASAGGGANINGVLYQLLWTLLRVSKLAVLDVEADASESLLSVIVVAEPSDGGDIQINGDHHEVEQLKARSDGSSWSLQDVIKKVLPDLFLAVSSDSNKPQTFRLVSEGGIGNWHSVYEDFFQDLRNRNWSENLHELSDSKLLSTGEKKTKLGPNPFFPDPCTERSLFLKICEVLGKRPSIKSLMLAEAEFQRRVWRLLERFDFCDPIQLQDIQLKVDALLLAVVDKDSDLPKTRDHLAIELAKLATSGDAKIDSADFLKQHGVDSVPLTNWVSHRERAKDVLERTLSRRAYSSKLNVRQIEGASNNASRIIVVCGESGCGKSWAINSLALKANASNNLPILIESRGNGEQDLKKVAEVFWHDIHDGDELLAFSRIEKRLRNVLGTETVAGVSVFIDGVRNFDEGKILLEYDWEAGNSQLAFSCSTEVGESLEQAYPHLVNVLRVDQFSWAQLHEYLYRRIGDAWPTIPTDIRSTLLTPLVASSYCDLFGDKEFRLENEYQLYEGVFQTRVAGKLTQTPLDETVIDRLAVSVGNGANYPWTKQQLAEAGMDDIQIARLLSNGWLAQPDSNSYRVFHDRLLNWSVASATERQLASKQISDDEFLSFLSDTYKGNPDSNTNFGYVPMDALWMLSTRQPEKTDLALQVIKTFENLSNQRYEDLYALIGTLGECISGVLLTRYQEIDLLHWRANVIASSLISTSGNNLELYVRQLIENTDPASQRKAVRLAKDSAFPSLVSQFWEVHVAAQNTPTLFGEKEERKVFLYQETFRVLNHAAKANIGWLDEQLTSSTNKTAEQLGDLATMVANIKDDGALWRKHKGMLIKELGDTNNRSLIRCIDRFRDSAEIHLLEEWIVPNDHVESAMAIQALARLDCDRAFRQLRNTSSGLMRLCKAWCFREIFETDRDKTNEAVLAWMNTVDDPWEIGILYEGRENDMTLEQLHCLLDCLVVRLSARFEERVGSSFHLEFGMLGRISNLELVECIRQRAGTDLEEQIEKFLLDLGPHRGNWGTVTGRVGALMTLHLMGANSLTRVINEFLLDDDQFGLHETIEWAAKAPNVETFRLLVDIVHSEESWPGSSALLVQNDALKCLASHERWKDVANGVKRLGRQLYRGLEHPGREVVDDWVEALRHEVKHAPNVGNVTALGVVGRQQDGEIILEVLKSCESDSDLALNCLVALKDCRYFEDDAVSQVAKYLKNKNHRYAANCFLTAAETPASWEVLIADLESSFDHVNALNLINFSSYSQRAIATSLEQLPKMRVFAEYEMLEILLTRIHNVDRQNQLLNNEFVQTFLHFEASKSEGRSWHTGSKERMIRCLALSNRELAFSACLRCIDNTDAKDRTRYPALLGEIDAKRSTSVLVDRLVDEDSTLMRNSILRTLRGLDLTGQIEALTNDECENKRRAACELLAISSKVASPELLLREHLNDSSDEVIHAAVTGLQTIRDLENRIELRTAIQAEADRAKRTALIDAFVNTCDPGEEHDLMTQDMQETMESLSWYEWENAKERLKKRAKKRDDALKRSDKRD